MWSITLQKEIIPDIKMATEIVYELNCVFDSFDVFHHSSSSTEMFDFHYGTDSKRREAWEITFLGRTVASGGGFGMDYDDCYDEDYVFLIPDNRAKIYNEAYQGAIGIVNSFLNIVSISDISSDTKRNWINIIEKGIQKAENNIQSCDDNYALEIGDAVGYKSIKVIDCFSHYFIPHNKVMRDGVNYILNIIGLSLYVDNISDKDLILKVFDYINNCHQFRLVNMQDIDRHFANMEDNFIKRWYYEYELHDILKNGESCEEYTLIFENFCTNFRARISNIKDKVKLANDFLSFYEKTKIIEKYSREIPKLISSIGDINNNTRGKNLKVYDELFFCRQECIIIKQSFSKNTKFYHYTTELINNMTEKLKLLKKRLWDEE